MENNKTILFLDSVIYDDIVKYSWLISGITTTPTFFNRDRVDFNEFATRIRNEYPNLELHVEALGLNPAETEKQLLDIMNKPWFSYDKVVIKIPVSFENLKIVSRYSEQGVKFNTHLIFNPSQAYLSVLSGATYVCPLIGRYADLISTLTGKNLHGGKNDAGKELLAEIINAVDRSPQKGPVGVMASSIRTVGDFANAVSAGAGIVTVPTHILEASIENEYTNQGLASLLKSLGF